MQDDPGYVCISAVLQTAGLCCIVMLSSWSSFACLLQRGLDSPGIAMMAGAGISTAAGTPPQGPSLMPGVYSRHPPGPMGSLQTTPQVCPSLPGEMIMIMLLMSSCIT